MIRRLMLCAACFTLPIACGNSPGNGGSTDAASPDAGGGGDGGEQSDGGVPNDSDGGAGFDGGASASPALRLFFSDLVSAPQNGGENGKGAYVTVYGRGFGASRGASTVTIGGGAADNYPVWTDSRVSFQLGAAAATGVLVVHVDGIGASNSVPFKVRAGNIRCVATNGNDGNSGLWGSCWQTVPGAVHNNQLASGDIIYLMAGVTATGEDPTASYTCAVCITEHGGTADAPTALVAYPGATVTLGSPTGPRAIRVPNVSVTADYWTLSNLHLEGISTIGVGGVSGTTGWRVIGNDMTCPNGNNGISDDACFEADRANAMAFYGNTVHDVSANTNPSKLYHAVYWSTDSNHIDVGWNQIGPSKACRGIQFHSSPTMGTDGQNQYDLHVHDNVIHDIRCDGINFATVDPSKGTVEAYNNVIYRAGAGPDPIDGGSQFSCIYNAGITNSGAPGSGSIEIYNNTLYDCGKSGGGAYASNGPVSMRLRNNIAISVGGEAYVSPDTSMSTPFMTGSNNLFFGMGAAPSFLTANVVSDPLFVNAAGLDFHLQAASPAKDQGLTLSLGTDLDGVPRPSGAAFDIGAFEHL